MPLPVLSPGTSFVNVQNTSFSIDALGRFIRNSTARVLAVDAGRFLVSEHVQNLANIGLNVPSAIPPAQDPGVARELVSGLPWRGNVDSPGLAYCTGGKSIY